MYSNSSIYIKEDDGHIVLGKVAIDGYNMPFQIKVGKNSSLKKLIIILHEHGANKKFASFHHDEWIVASPHDIYGTEGKGSWWLGEKGVFFTFNLLQYFIQYLKEYYDVSEVYFWGSSMGAYGALLHGTICKAHAIYAHMPQVKLQGTDYTDGDNLKYYASIFGKEKSDYIDLVNYLSKVDLKDSPVYFLSQNIFDYPNYLKQHFLPLVTVFEEKGFAYAATFNLLEGHTTNLNIAQTVESILDKNRSKILAWKEGNNLVGIDYIRENILEKLEISIQVSKEKILITRVNDFDKCTYACHLYYNGKVLDKRHYQRDRNFVFELHQGIELSHIQIKFYVRYSDIVSDIRVSKTFKVSELDSKDLKDDINMTPALSILQSTVSDYLTSKQLLKEGEMLFEQQSLLMKPFEAVKWNNWTNWEVNPLNNRSWQWRLNSFFFIKGLISYADKSQNNEVLDYIKIALTSWFDQYLLNSSTNFEFAWHDHATALRAEEVIVLRYYLMHNNPEWLDQNDSFKQKLLEALFIFGDKLATDDFYSEHTNHGLEQVRVLLLLGNALDKDRWVSIAVDRLSSELDFSFTKEGVHKENSPGYHQFVLKVFLGIIEDYPSNLLPELHRHFNNIAPKALQFVTYILRPDNNMPIIGDTELKSTTDGYAKFFSGTKEYEEFLYSFTQGKHGEKPSKTNIVYPESGYAIFRNMWGAADDFHNSIQIVFKAGCLSRYHHQQDENNFVIYGYGEDWIIDSGLYNYINQDPIRYYVRRRQAHNIPIISNTTYLNEDFSHRINNWSIYNYSENDESAYISAKNTVLQTVSHDRTIQLIRSENEIVVTDEVICLDQQERRVSFLLHVPKDKTVSIADNGSIKIASSLSNKALLLSFSDNPNSIEIKQGRDGDLVNSVVSYKANSYDESQVIKLNFDESKKVNLVMKMKFI